MQCYPMYCISHEPVTKAFASGTRVLDTDACLYLLLALSTWLLLLQTPLWRHAIIPGRTAWRYWLMGKVSTWQPGKRAPLYRVCVNMVTTNIKLMLAYTNHAHKETWRIFTWSNSERFCRIHLASRLGFQSECQPLHRVQPRDYAG